MKELTYIFVSDLEHNVKVFSSMSVDDLLPEFSFCGLRRCIRPAPTAVLLSSATFVHTRGQVSQHSGNII